MVLTPSTTSGGIAGGVFWSMLWLTLAELDALAELFHLPAKYFSSKRIFAWVLKHKGTSLICTELVNYSIHGIKSTTGVVFALGGTFVNAIAIFGVLPIISRIKGKSWLYGDYR